MNTISVTASKNYNVIVGQNLMQQTGNYIKQVGNYTKIAIISDRNVWPLYGKIVVDSLANENIPCCQYVIPAGEENKNGENYLAILNFLAENQITRSDLIIALGGGVVGDITGFAAATFLRGLSFVQIPTTLLAMVDSSVGGKTAIDLPAGKNLAGAFYQPSLVLCDIDVLQTLPEDIFRDGCAEVIKYGILFDETLFEHLCQKGTAFDREYVISRCVELKRDIVAEDEFDRGSRQLLNLGHTIGHGVEANSNYTLSHGKAVAIGIAIVSKAARFRQLCSEEVYKNIINILDIFSLPKTANTSADSLYTSALSDKKRSGGTVNLIVPRIIGKCEIYPTKIDDLRSFIEAGL